MKTSLYLEQQKNQEIGQILLFNMITMIFGIYISQNNCLSQFIFIYFPVMLLQILCMGILLSFANPFMIQSEGAINAQTGNITQEQLTTIKNVIINAEGGYSETSFNQIARNISLTLKVTLSNFRWSVYVFDKGIKELAVSPFHLQKKKYLSIINFGKYNLSYQIYGSNSGYGCNQTGGGGSAQFGEDINQTQQEKIISAVNNSIIYRGDNIEGAAEYIANKTDSSLNSFVVIANPTTLFGFYICRYKQYWASLRNFGEFKWNYYVSYF